LHAKKDDSGNRVRFGQSLKYSSSVLLYTCRAAVG
jgi:hypothetical protein